MKGTLAGFLGSSLLATGVAFSCSILATNSAQALSISFDSTSQSSNSTATGASAKVDFNFSQSGENVLVNLDIFNTTGQVSAFGAGATESVLMGITFDLAEDVDIVASSYDGGSYFSNLLSDVSFQPFSNHGDNFDIAIAKNSNFQGGNTRGGLSQGLSSTVSFLLSAKDLSAEEVKDQFRTGLQNGTFRIASRFQAVNAGSGSDKLLRGTISGDDSEPDSEYTSIPEPTSALGLLMLGTLGTGSALKRKLKQS